MIKRLFRSIRKRIAPTPHEMTFKRWCRDCGDKKLRYSYPLDADSLVFDLGGYQGEWAAGIHQRYGAKVEIFEPVESFAGSIRERFANNAAIRVHACGLGGTTRTEQLAMCRDGSSVFRAADEIVPVEIVDVQEWFAREAVGEVALMKINIEGGEYELLERMLDAGLVRQVQDIQVQFHNLWPDSEARMEGILSRLSATHEPTWQYPFVWENWRRR